MGPVEVRKQEATTGDASFDRPCEAVNSQESVISDQWSVISGQ